jgi:hypothetical protein
MYILVKTDLRKVYYNEWNPKINAAFFSLNIHNVEKYFK